MFSSSRWPAAVLAFAGSFGVYLATLCPTVYVEGSGELIGAVHALGTPHPTGYPLFVLAGRLFSALLPFFDSVAYRINVATAFTAALAVAALSAFLRDRGCRPWISLAGGLLFAFSGTFWSNAVVAEVYGASMLGAVAMIWLGLRAAEVPDPRNLMLAGYAAGMALTTHLSQSLILPGLLSAWAWHWYRGRPNRPPAAKAAELTGRAAKVAAAAILGYSLVLYLPLRSSLGPGFHWGPLDTPTLFWDHITGAEYRFAFFSMPATGILLNAGRWLEHLFSAYTPALCLVAVWGLWVSARRDGTTAWVVGTTVLINLAVALNYHRDPNGIGVFFLLSFLGAAVFIAYGLEDLCLRLGRVFGRGGIPAAAAVAAVAVVMAMNYREADRKGIDIAHRYGMDILAGLPQNAILITEGDDASFIVDYLSRVEGARPDVTLYMRAGRGTDILPASARNLKPREKARVRRRMIKRLVEESVAGRPVHFLAPRDLPAKGFDFVPAGLSYRVLKTGTKLAAEMASPDTAGAAAAGDLADPWARIIQANYWFKRGENLLFREEREEALVAFERAAEIAHDSRTIRYNVALRLDDLGKHDRAWVHIKAAIAIDPMMPQVYKLADRILRRAGRRQELPALRREAARWGQPT